MCDIIAYCVCNPSPFYSGCHSVSKVQGCDGRVQSDSRGLQREKQGQDPETAQIQSVTPGIQKKGDWKRPPTPCVKGLTSGEALRVMIRTRDYFCFDRTLVVFQLFLALLSTSDHSGAGRYSRKVSLYH